MKKNNHITSKNRPNNKKKIVDGPMKKSLALSTIRYPKNTLLESLLILADMNPENPNKAGNSFKAEQTHKE
jgi:hypothetical protein